MPNVLILSLVFAPDGVSTAQIMSELAVDLQALGHRVSVITSQPHYNRDVVAEKTQPLSRIWGGWLFRSDYNGIPVFHTRMPSRARNRKGRILGWLIFHFVGFIAALRMIDRPDVIIIPSPLLSVAIMGHFVNKLRGGEYIYNVQELYPDLAIKLGAVSSPTLIKLLQWLERLAYRKAAAITVISDGMKKSLLGKGVAGSKLHVVPNFVDVDHLRPLGRDNEFSRNHGLGDRFVVCYAGNMGLAQGLELLVDAAETLRNDPTIVFLMVGNGVLKEKLQRSVADKQLSNVIFVDHQPYAIVPEIYAASDLCVVPVLDSISFDALPSKVYRIMACGRPVLALTNPSSDLGQLVVKSGAGRVVEPQNCRAVAAAIVEQAQDPGSSEAMGRAGRLYASENVARSIVTSVYSKLVSGVAAHAKRAR
jgi:colanic acid biosynthesis glycosyl transferase WcaI